MLWDAQEDEMQCDRCKEDFPEADLRPVDRKMLKTWDIATLVFGSGVLSDSERDKRYCPDCEYSLNSLLRILVVIGVVSALICAAGLVVWIASLLPE